MGSESDSRPAGSRRGSGPAGPARRILLIEDEPALVTTLSDRLASEGYLVESAADGIAGLERAATGSFDLVLLDVMLPGRDGFDVCRELRRRGSEVPVLMLTARSQAFDKVLGLKLGADDYLTKPFDMMELLARIEVQLRRRTDVASGAPRYRFGDVVLDTRTTEVRRGGAPVELSAREFLLLKYFAEHSGTTLTRERLLNDVWGYHAMPSTRTVDVHVAWLRQKIEPDPRHPRHILTVHGLGYKFVG